MSRTNGRTTSGMSARPLVDPPVDGLGAGHPAGPTGPAPTGPGPVGAGRRRAGRLRVGLITPDPGHPLLAATAALLGGSGEAVVEAVAPDGGPPTGEPATVYLLKSRTPQAISLARTLEAAGAVVLNSAAATARCQDRTAMAADALRAGLPFAATRTYRSAADLAAGEEASGAVPVVVKSRHSGKGDVVRRLEGSAALRDFAARAPHGPYIAQDFVPNAGWDHKLWAIGPHVFAALRRSELAGPAGAAPGPAAIPDAWRDLVRRTGEVFALVVYGVDVIATPDGPLIVDVNAFPGVRDQPGAPEALADLTLRAARGRHGGPEPSSRKAR
ncbi:hypothetical protein SZN_25285 [Streptomyces zinciresistens K42]|uniref:ATP-grasp fold RimK-type domain-containing protein n=1 Tax=Streptomyces zinciresistens K42 TaxID=700597 RepID=G2GHR8_9ACTN|nr:hypothetical protein [Streptomyces zinciresistens]EGX56962.1 hypothetical protein SZN_25285 [Streptomyces zinciresistens K42]